MRIAAALLVPMLAWATLAPRRILVATWAVDGGPGKPRLVHGQADATDFADAFSQLGGVTANDRIVEEVTDTESLSRVWLRASTLLDSAKVQGFPTELILFHTGHADAGGILLGSQKTSWEDLRRFLARNDGTLRVAFLDACASGSALRQKGGKFHAALPLPVASGQALLASSRADELSTESDKDGGSLFTRSVVSGLRGAADADRDGRVTLSELFRHASSETELRAKQLGAPSQHPSGSTELLGTIDPVLTDLRNPPARLRLEPGFPALSVRDSSHRSLGTAQTGSRDTLDLALPPGLWTLESDSGREKVLILLHPGETRVVSPLELVHVPIATPTAPVGDTATRWVPINFGILPPVSINGNKPRLVRNAFSMDLILGESKIVNGFQFSGVMSRIFGDASGFQMSIGSNTVTGEMKGFQLSVANQIERSLVGMQLGSDLNLVEGDLTGTQIGGLMNVARGTVVGAQIAGGASYAGTMEHGAQIAMVTVAGHATGMQSGLVNVAGEINGLQIGLINVGSGSGARFGLLNVVPAGKPISVGALSVGGDMELHPAFQMNQNLSNRLLLRSRMDWFQSGLAWEGLPLLKGDHSLSIETSARFKMILAPELGFAWIVTGANAGLSPDLVAGFTWPLLTHLAPFVQARWSLETSKSSIWTGLEF